MIELGTNHVQHARECLSAASSAPADLRVFYVAAARCALARADEEIATARRLLVAHEAEIKRLGGAS